MNKNFLGIPIEGEIQKSRRVVQKPLEEFSPIMQAVLDDPTVVDFGWFQYTPYFNDGDPCEFGIHGIWVRTQEDVEREQGEDMTYDRYDLDIRSLPEHPSLGKRSATYDPTSGRHVWGDYEGPDEERYDRVQALAYALEAGHFENVLLDLFGDHASVKVTKEKIELELYEHD